MRGSAAVSLERALLDKYCLTCHNEKLRTAGLMLDKLDVEDVAKDAERWEHVLAKVTSREMPPPGMPRPDRSAMEGFHSWLVSALDRAAAARPNPGRVAIHRLNRTEYTNAIRDLLALDIDGQSLLVADDQDEHGFDNIAGVLSVSPVLLDRYMSAAHRISRLAVGDPTILAGFETYDIPKTLAQDVTTSDELPFGTVGGAAIHHYFPVDGEYIVRVRLRKQLYGYILGLGQPQQIDVRLDGKRVKLFTVGGDAPGKPVPDSYAADIPAAPEWEEYMHFADSGLEVRVPVKAGRRVVGVSFVRDRWEPEGVLRPPENDKIQAITHKYNDDAAIESVSIGGPYHASSPTDTPSRRKIFSCHPADVSGQETCARRILSTIARRAYRRPATDEDIRTLLDFYNAGRIKGGFEAGIQLALERILVDPDFLFRIEHNHVKAVPGSVHHLSDIELASRLSFFLWSSIPDDELLDTAIRKKLSDPAVLERQVDRMLADARSKALVDGFATRWLGLPKLRNIEPDADVFPDFDENLRNAFQQETELFLESQLRGDRSLLELLDANYTFLNERLAKHYQIPNVYGNRFRRITVTKGHRGGILGQGGILIVTSYPNRTSPVLRGKWVLDNILGTPPPPPPPEVPALKESSESGAARSMREIMEQHRNNPSCAVCHVRMDPIGFALENFDAVGRWRDRDGGRPVDAAGILPDGTKLDGLAGLKKALLAHPEQFAGTFIERLMSYALGREVEYYDLPVVRRITREAAVDNYRWSSIIKGIIKSDPFQMSIVEAPLQTRR